MNETNEKGKNMNKKLYVGNLSYSITDDDLHANFSDAGEVASLSIIKDKFTGQSKGFGFVEMKTEEGAAEAIKRFHGGMLDGRAITVNEARPRESFGGNGGRNSQHRNNGGGFNRGRREGGRY
jgi:RNA recognition motif-containing protein